MVLMNATKKKSVLIVLYYYHPYVSGLSNYAKELAEGLVGKGFAVTVLTTRFDKKLPGDSLINGVNVIRLPVMARFGKGVIAPTFWLKIILLAQKFDFVNIHLPMADGGLSSFFIDKNKIITTYHCDLNLGKGLINVIIQRISYFLMERILTKSRYVVVNSLEYFSHSCMKKYVRKAIEIYPPIHFDQFQRSDYQELLSALSIRQESFKIGFIGRLVYEKGLEYLLGAIPYLQECLDDFVIIIAGEEKNVAGGTIRNDLDKYVKLYPHRIVFTGYLNHNKLLQFYSMVDVLVLPSIDPLESFGMVQVEAMLCGTPVIASDLAGVRTIVLETGFGSLAKPRNSLDIASKIYAVSKSELQLDAMKLQKFKASISIEKYEELFTTSPAVPHA
jgi:glycosyltransferase involved in cell wall biosynthesis